MLEVTDAALDRMEKMLEEAGAPPTVAVRLTLSEDEPRLQADRVRASDEVFHKEDRVVLVVDEATSARLGDKRLTLGEGGRPELVAEE